MYNNLVKVNDMLYTFDKNGFPYAVSNTEGTPDSIKEEFTIVDAWATAHPSLVGTPTVEPVLTLAEQAQSMSMLKDDFIEMVEQLTYSFSLVDPTSIPITFSDMWEWCATDPVLLRLFISKQEVFRNDAIFNETTTKFAPQFLQYLDMMFVYQYEIMLEIEQSKAEGRPMDLTALLPQG